MQSTDNTYSWFIKSFHAKSGLDLNYYKQNQMERRILSFITTHNYSNYPEFLNALCQNPKLYDTFLKHLTINVTQFFRDLSQWKSLQDVLSQLVTKKSHLKIWSAGCSSGQEPYSLAMTLLEHFPKVSFSILATDIDKAVLQQAKDGVYKSMEVAGTPTGMLTKYFTNSDKGYEIKDVVKQKVHFKYQNLLTDTFDREFDLIACRNVVIYFTEDAKDMLYKKFCGALTVGGVLFTGSTEHLFGVTDLGFKPISSFFYQKQY